MSARSFDAESIVQPWKLVPITGNGVTGRKPRFHSPLSLPSRIVLVASGHARTESRRPIAAGTKTSSVRSIPARSTGGTLGFPFANAGGANDPSSRTARATARRRTLRH